jgi:hypothetical protein
MSVALFLAANFSQSAFAAPNWNYGLMVDYNDPCDFCFGLTAFSDGGPQLDGQLARIENQLARGLYLIQVVDFNNEVVWVEKLIK